MRWKNPKIYPITQSSPSAQYWCRAVISQAVDA